MGIRARWSLFLHALTQNLATAEHNYKAKFHQNIECGTGYGPTLADPFPALGCGSQCQTAAETSIQTIPFDHQHRLLNQDEISDGSE